jgi:hypothetical protein
MYTVGYKVSGMFFLWRLSLSEDKKVVPVLCPN